MAKAPAAPPESGKKAAEPPSKVVKKATNEVKKGREGVSRPRVGFVALYISQIQFFMRGWYSRPKRKPTYSYPVHEGAMWNDGNLNLVLLMNSIPQQQSKAAAAPGGINMANLDKKQKQEMLRDQKKLLGFDFLLKWGAPEECKQIAYVTLGLVQVLRFVKKQAPDAIKDCRKLYSASQSAQPDRCDLLYHGWWYTPNWDDMEPHELKEVFTIYSGLAESWRFDGLTLLNRYYPFIDMIEGSDMAIYSRRWTTRGSKQIKSIWSDQDRLIVGAIPPAENMALSLAAAKLRPKTPGVSFLSRASLEPTLKKFQQIFIAILYFPLLLFVLTTFLHLSFKGIRGGDAAPGKRAMEMEAVPYNISVGGDLMQSFEEFCSREIPMDLSTCTSSARSNWNEVRKCLSANKQLALFLAERAGELELAQEAEYACQHNLDSKRGLDPVFPGSALDLYWIARLRTHCNRDNGIARLLDGHDFFYDSYINIFYFLSSQQTSCRPML